MNGKVVLRGGIGTISTAGTSYRHCYSHVFFFCCLSGEILETAKGRLQIKSKLLDTVQMNHQSWGRENVPRMYEMQSGGYIAQYRCKWWEAFMKYSLCFIGRSLDKFTKSSFSSEQRYGHTQPRMLITWIYSFDAVDEWFHTAGEVFNFYHSMRVYLCK